MKHVCGSNDCINSNIFQTTRLRMPNQLRYFIMVMKQNLTGKCNVRHVPVPFDMCPCVQTSSKLKVRREMIYITFVCSRLEAKNSWSNHLRCKRFIMVYSKTKNAKLVHLEIMFYVHSPVLKQPLSLLLPNPTFSHLFLTHTLSPGFFFSNFLMGGGNLPKTIRWSQNIPPKLNLSNF